MKPISVDHDLHPLGIKKAFSLYFFLSPFMSGGDDACLVEDIFCVFRLLRIKFSGINKFRVNVCGG